MESRYLNIKADNNENPTVDGMNQVVVDVISRLSSLAIEDGVCINSINIDINYTVDESASEGVAYSAKLYEAGELTGKKTEEKEENEQKPQLPIFVTSDRSEINDKLAKYFESYGGKDIASASIGFKDFIVKYVAKARLVKNPSEEEKEMMKSNLVAINRYMATNVIGYTIFSEVAIWKDRNTKESQKDYIFKSLMPWIDILMNTYNVCSIHLHERDKEILMNYIVHIINYEFDRYLSLIDHKDNIPSFFDTTRYFMENHMRDISPSLGPHTNEFLKAAGVFFEVNYDLEFHSKKWKFEDIHNRYVDKSSIITGEFNISYLLNEEFHTGLHKSSKKLGSDIVGTGRIILLTLCLLLINRCDEDENNSIMYSFMDELMDPDKPKKIINHLYGIYGIDFEIEYYPEAYDIVYKYHENDEEANE